MRLRTESSDESLAALMFRMPVLEYSSPRPDDPPSPLRVLPPFPLLVLVVTAYLEAMPFRLLRFEHRQLRHMRQSRVAPGHFYGHCLQFAASLFGLHARGLPSSFPRTLSQPSQAENYLHAKLAAQMKKQVARKRTIPANILSRTSYSPPTPSSNLSSISSSVEKLSRV